jgi:hypothetical protein
MRARDLATARETGLVLTPANSPQCFEEVASGESRQREPGQLRAHQREQLGVIVRRYDFDCEPGCRMRSRHNPPFRRYGDDMRIVQVSTHDIIGGAERVA